MSYSGNKLKSMTVLLAICLITINTQAGPKIYDDFSTVYVNPLNWDARGVDDPHEFVREINNGTLHLRLRGLGGTTTTVGLTSTRNAMDLPTQLVPDTKIMQTVLKVNKAAVRGCSITGADNSRVRFAQIHSLFSAGGSTGVGNFTGVVAASLSIERTDTDTFKKDRLAVVATFNRCDNPDCTQVTNLFPVDDPNTTDVDEAISRAMGRVKIGEALSLRTVWDATAQTILFRVKKAGKPAKVKKLDYSSLVVHAGPLVNLQFAQSIQARTEIANCNLTDDQSDPSVKRPRGVIDVSINKFSWADTI